MEENEAAISAEQLCLHRIYKELSKQPPSCHYMEFNSSLRLQNFSSGLNLRIKTILNRKEFIREILNHARGNSGDDPNANLGRISPGTSDEL